VCESFSQQFSRFCYFPTAEEGRYFAVNVANKDRSSDRLYDKKYQRKNIKNKRTGGFIRSNLRRIVSHGRPSLATRWKYEAAIFNYSTANKTEETVRKNERSHDTQYNLTY
jgi:hypothetical protein